MSKLAILFTLVLGAAIAIPLNKDDSEDWRIIGGSDAADGQFPYQIYLKRNNRHTCGGSIISPNWILTAAHCLYGMSTSNLKVVVGTNYRNSSGTSYEVSLVINHEKYNPARPDNDIAIIKVVGNITLGDKVQVIELADVVPSYGTECVLAGWGLTSFPGESSNNLQYVTLNTMSVSECQKAMPENAPKVRETNVCTHTSVGKGSCIGDSGGPLVAGSQQIGVLSWDVPCAEGIPDVYASVAAYRDWIREKTGI